LRGAIDKQTRGRHLFGGLFFLKIKSTGLRFFIFPAIAFALYACNPQPAAPASAERVEYFENGQVSRRVSLVHGKREGKMTDYYNDGHLMAERYFANGMQEGRTLIYYPSGQLKEVQYFQKGKKHGGDTLWYESGQVQFVSTLQDDKLHGYLRKWAPTGELVYEAKYDLDTLIEVKGQPIDRNTSAAKPSQILKKGNE
jgi:antitoxin component YwqK of YwqJK toxin-antitoxin module